MSQVMKLPKLSRLNVQEEQGKVNKHFCRLSLLIVNPSTLMDFVFVFNENNNTYNEWFSSKPFFIRGKTNILNVDLHRNILDLTYKHIFETFLQLMLTANDYS